MSEEILKLVVAQVGGTVVESLEIPSPSPPEEEVRPKVENKALAEEPKELVVSFPDFLQDSVVSFLKYLDVKRENDVSKEARFYVQLVRNRTKIKRAVVVKREWKAAIAMAHERVASFSSECATMKVTLQERQDHLWAKEMECKVLRLNLAKEKDLRASSEWDCTSLRVDIENAQKATIDLRHRLEASKVDFNEEKRHVAELIADLAKRDQLHAAKLAAKEKECRAEEEQKPKGLRRQIGA